MWIPGGRGFQAEGTANAKTLRHSTLGVLVEWQRGWSRVSEGRAVGKETPKIMGDCGPRGGVWLHSEAAGVSLKGFEQGAVPSDSYLNRIPPCGRINIASLLGHGACHTAITQ